MACPAGFPEIFLLQIFFFNFFVSAFFNHVIFWFSCCVSVLYKRVVWTSFCIWAWCTCCISVLHNFFLCVLYFLCCIFSKERNNLITIKRKLEKRWLGLGLGLGLGLIFVLYFSVLYFSCWIFALCFSCLIYILKNKITLTIQNIDVAQENTA